VQSILVICDVLRGLHLMRLSLFASTVLILSETTMSFGMSVHNDVIYGLLGRVEPCLSVEECYQREESLYYMSVALASIGRHDRAIDMANQIGDPTIRRWALISISSSFASVGDFQVATSLLEEEPDSNWLIQSLVFRLSKSGAYPAALFLANSIDDTGLSMSTKLAVTTHIADSGQMGHARRTLSQLIEDIRGNHLQIDQRLLAVVMAYVGDELDPALDIHGSFSSSELNAFQTCLVYAYVASGKYQQAVNAFKRIDGDSTKVAVATDLIIECAAELPDTAADRYIDDIVNEIDESIESFWRGLVSKDDGLETQIRRLIAEDGLKAAFEKSQRLGDTVLRTQLYCDIGVKEMRSRVNTPDTLSKGLRTAIRLAERENDLPLKLNMTLCLVNAFISVDRFELAQEYVYQLLEIVDEYGYSRLVHLGFDGELRKVFDCCLVTGQNDRALRVLEASLEAADGLFHDGAMPAGPYYWSRCLIAQGYVQLKAYREAALIAKNTYVGPLQQRVYSCIVNQIVVDSGIENGMDWVLEEVPEHMRAYVAAHCIAKYCALRDTTTKFLYPLLIPPSIDPPVDPVFDPAVPYHYFLLRPVETKSTEQR
jgi:tetratricopeptide (TPR) repeat protein